MSAYLDASVVVSLFVRDAHTPDAFAWLEGLESPPSLTRWTALEFSSALAAKARGRALAPAGRSLAEGRFEGWLADARLIPVTDADLGAARDMIRFDQAPLKAGDALHLAVARRAGLPLKTFDKPLARAAEALGVGVA